MQLWRSFTKGLVLHGEGSVPEDWGNIDVLRQGAVDLAALRRQTAVAKCEKGMLSQSWRIDFIRELEPHRNWHRKLKALRNTGNLIKLFDLSWAASNSKARAAEYWSHPHGLFCETAAWNCAHQPFLLDNWHGYIIGPRWETSGVWAKITSWEEHRVLRHRKQEKTCRQSSSNHNCLKGRIISVCVCVCEPGQTRRDYFNKEPMPWS